MHKEPLYPRIVSGGAAFLASLLLVGLGDGFFGETYERFRPDRAFSEKMGVSAGEGLDRSGHVTVYPGDAPTEKFRIIHLPPFISIHRAAYRAIGAVLSLGMGCAAAFIPAIYRAGPAPASSRRRSGPPLRQIGGGK